MERNRFFKIVVLLLVLSLNFNLLAQKKEKESTDWTQQSFQALKFRSLGPATTSGRIADIAVHPNNSAEYYLALASGGIFKTTNNGTTFEPVFENEAVYSVGCLAIDPTNPNVIWAGTGENNNQRSVAYGDGVYVSRDGGKSWHNAGLETSEHIGMIAIDPHDGNHLYVAAYGPLWSAGGERGVYETKDGGATWDQILYVSEHTGFNEIHMDPNQTNILYALAHQRRRHVFTYLSGGPESAVYKSTDGGKNWTKLTNGLPTGDVGRIGMDISPANSNVLYATVEGHGTYKSTDKGESWTKQSGHNTSGNYYVELIAHPLDENTIYSMDTYGMVSKNGGQSFQRIPKKFKHVDNHCLWIDPNNPKHMLIGTDGGLYETWDDMKNWFWRANLPTIQFYRVAVDGDWPFYNIYGGTQDNNSLGGPSQTVNARGIINEDWFVTNGGDGFESAIDPEENHIVYAQAQYGWLVRFDKRTGEKTPIQPQPGLDEPAYRWNWDAPLLASKHKPKTLYFAANKVFKSTDRGDSWTVISEDLSRQLDRNTLPIMDRYWGPEAIALHKSTSIYGNIVSMKESPINEGELWIGTDDGLVWRTKDDGQNWTPIKNFNNLPKTKVGSLSLPLVYVQDLLPSRHDSNSIYVAFNNHKNGDFAPYLFRSKDNGNSWVDITSNLPEKGSIYSIAEDHIDENLLFVGTEFGLYVSLDGGENWKKFDSGLPTIAVRDIAIQERENDLVLATFGRGFYVLDNYSPLRSVSNISILEGSFFATKPGLLYNEANIGGIGYKGGQYYRAQNKPVGVTFTYYLEKAAKRSKDDRPKADVSLPHYPNLEQLKSEDWEEKPYLLFSISDSTGREIVRFTKPDAQGIQRFTWDGKMSSKRRINAQGDPITSPSSSYFVSPGTYTITGWRSTNGTLTKVLPDHRFEVNHLYMSEEIDPEFNASVDQLYANYERLHIKQRSLETKLTKLKAGVRNTPGASLGVLDSLRSVETTLKSVNELFNGDQTRAKREYEYAPGVSDRISLLAWGAWNHRGAPTGTMKEQYNTVEALLARIDSQLESITESVERMEEQIRDQGVPYWD